MKTYFFIIAMLLSVITLQAVTPVSYEYDDAGNLVLRHVVTLGQTQTSPGNVSKSLGEDDYGRQKIVIYPNPTQGIFSIGITGLENDKQNFYLLYDLSGRLIKRSNITSDHTSVDVTWNASGVYLLDVSLGGKISRWKVVKQ
jgi:YD repeat-containing protein